MAFDEILTWTNADVRMQIGKLLPEGWTFTCNLDQENHFWVAEVKNEDGEVSWGTFNPDERLALLAVFGHMWSKSHKRPAPGTPWGPRRQELIRRYVTSRVERPPDPEDLDPEEVASVYESVLNPKKR